MARVALILALALSAVSGCGQLPDSQARIVSFSASGFTIPVPVAYATMSGARAMLPGISPSRHDAEAQINNLIQQAAMEVLYERGRKFGLLDAVIAAVLQQIHIEVNYVPFGCDTVLVYP